MKHASVLSAVALISCGPGVREDDGPQQTETGASETGATDETGGSGGLPLDTTLQFPEPTATDTLETTTTGDPGGWATPEFIVQFETRAGNRPTALLATRGWVFATASFGSTTWRMNERTRNVVAASGGGALLVASASYVYAEGRGPCCSRFEIETFAADTIDSSGWIAGGGDAGVAFFRYGPNPPPMDTQILSWIPDGTQTDADVFESPELVRVFGVNSSAVIAELGADIVGIEIGSWVATTLVEDPRGLEGVLAGRATEERLYLIDQATIRAFALTGTEEDEIDASAAPYSVVADEATVAWIDAADLRRVWAAPSGTSAAVEVVEAEVGVVALALGEAGLYWVDFEGRLYRSGYPS